MALDEQGPALGTAGCVLLTTLPPIPASHPTVSTPPPPPASHPTAIPSVPPTSLSCFSLCVPVRGTLQEDGHSYREKVTKSRTDSRERPARSLCRPGPSSRSPDSDSVSPGPQRPPPSSQRAPQKLQAPSPPPAPVGSDPWGGPVLGPWDPTFTSDALPFLDRLPKPKAGPRPPSMHYCEVCRVSCAGPQVRTGS